MRMKVVGKKWIARGFLMALVGMLFVAIGSEVVMQLWNWLTPRLFGWHAITLWEALGLLALCRILFGGFGGRSHHRRQWRHRMRDRWAELTPEEREKFRVGMQDRCGHFGTSATEPKA